MKTIDQTDLFTIKTKAQNILQNEAPIEGISIEENMGLRVMLEKKGFSFHEDGRIFFHLPFASWRLETGTVEKVYDNGGFSVEKLFINQTIEKTVQKILEILNE